MAKHPTKFPIKSNDEVLQKLMQLLEASFFNNDVMYNPNFNPKALYNRGKRLSELADKYGVYLNAEQLRRWLIAPYHERSDVTLSKDYFQRLCTLLINASADFKYEDEAAIILEFQTKYGNSAVKTNGSENANGIIAVDAEKLHPELNGTGPFAKHNSIIGSLTASPWYFYERYGIQHNKDSKSKFGICVGKATFSFKGNKLTVVINFIYDGLHREYKGEAAFDDGLSYLYIVLTINDSGGKKATISLRLAEADLVHQSIMIGHFTFFARDENHILTNTIVLQKTSDRIKEFEIGNYAYGSKKYREIDPEITRFLYSRERNRLSLPGGVVSNRKELLAFLLKKESKLNRELRHFVDEYYVYYKKAHNELVEDELKIWLNPEKVVFEGEYIHRPDESGKNDKQWLGQAYFNSKIIVLELSEFAGSANQQEDPVLLTFHTPDEKIPYDESECFYGLLSGLQDSSRVPVSFICLVVRKTAANFKRLKDKRVRKYFNKAKNFKLITSPCGFKLNSIK
jgi:hypothetical protein